MLEHLSLHHIGIATKSIERSKQSYQKLGYTATKTVYDPNQKVNISFLSRENSLLLELIEPATEDAPVNNILKRSGTTPYHLCYETDGIERQIAQLKQEKFLILQQPIAAPALNHRKISFLFHRYIGLIELVEK